MHSHRRRSSAEKSLRWIRDDHEDTVQTRRCRGRRFDVRAGGSRRSAGPVSTAVGGPVAKSAALHDVSRRRKSASNAAPGSRHTRHAYSAMRSSHGSGSNSRGSLLSPSATVSFAGGVRCPARRRNRAALPVCAEERRVQLRELSVRAMPVPRQPRAGLYLRQLPRSGAVRLRRNQRTVPLPPPPPAVRPRGGCQQRLVNVEPLCGPPSPNPRCTAARGEQHLPRVRRGPHEHSSVAPYSG